jgi:hypothetical protein
MGSGSSRHRRFTTKAVTVLSTALVMMGCDGRSEREERGEGGGGDSAGTVGMGGDHEVRGGSSGTDAGSGASNAGGDASGGSGHTSGTAGAGEATGGANSGASGVAGVSGADNGGSGSAGSNAAGSAGSLSGASGSAGTAGASGEVLMEWTFDTELEGWALAPSQPLFESTLLTFDATAPDGTTAGCARLEVPFDGQDQVALIEVPIPPTDLWQARLEARVMLGAGLTDDPMNPGGVQPYAWSGGGSVLAHGTWSNLGPDERGHWVNAALLFADPVDDPWLLEFYNPSDIDVVGLRFSTGSIGTDYRPAVFCIDWIRIVRHP